MIGCYVTGIFPRPKKLVEVTRAHDRGKVGEKELERAFEDATLKVINAQVSAGLSHITDGMIRWQDLFRSFAENLNGVRIGSLARWFNNNMFYKKPVIEDDIWRKKSAVEEIAYIKCLPKHLPWKVILPAPYTFVQLSQNQFYKDKTEFMLKYAQILREEIEDLAKLGFEYVQLSDPALVYKPTAMSISEDELSTISEALRVVVEGISVKTCLQTFFGDFSQILPEALDFPVDHLGIDLYETDFEKLKGYSFEKGLSLGLVDSRSSLVENRDELGKVAKEIIESIYHSKIGDIFVCPNCDLEFLPWERAEEKMRVIGDVAELLREEFYE